MLIREGCKYNRSTTRVRELSPNPYKILERRLSFLPLVPFVAPTTFVFPLVRPYHDKHGAKAHLPLRRSSAIETRLRRRRSCQLMRGCRSIRSLTIPSINGFPFLLVSQDFYQSITLVILYHGYHHRFRFERFLFFVFVFFFFLNIMEHESFVRVLFLFLFLNAI